MLDAFAHAEPSQIIAVNRLPRGKLPRGGVAFLGATPPKGGLRRVMRLVEKPHDARLARRAATTGEPFAIVGRYLLRPEIFPYLARLHDTGRRPVELTDALELARQDRARIEAFVVKAKRDDIGEALEQARALDTLMEQ